MMHSDDAATFTFAASVSDVAVGSAIRVEVNGLNVALFNVDGNIFALDEICTHAHASLVDGYIEGAIVECPLHGATFCIRTGRALTAPATENLGKYPVRVENGEILIDTGQHDSNSPGGAVTIDAS